MTFLMFIITAVVFLFTGYFMGSRKLSDILPEKKAVPKLEVEKQTEEYLNFLSYDGTEQI